MSERNFQPGEIVDIVIKGVRITPPGVGQTPHIRILDERGHEYVMPPQAAIEYAAPAEWPPRIGDLWEDRDGHVWLAQVTDDDASDELNVLMVPSRARLAQGLYPTEESVLQEFGPLVLIHRKQQDGGGQDA